MLTIKHLKQQLGIEKKAEIVSFSQTAGGKIILLLLMTVAFYLFRGQPWWPQTIVQKVTWWPTVMVALAAMSFFPSYRRILLLIVTLFGLSQLPWFKWWAIRNLLQQHALPANVNSTLLHVICVISTMLLGYLYLLAAKRYRQHRLMRHPVRNLLIFLFICMWLSSDVFSGLTQVYAWSFTLVLSAFIWYFGYALLDIRSLSPKAACLSYGHFLPFWGGTTTPFPKGAAYLKKIEAQDAQALAVSQLRGVKLIYWGFCVYLGLILLRVATDYWHIPTLLQALAHDAGGARYACGLAWAVLVMHFMTELLIITVNGHIIIAIVRMAGFNALRNTYKPLYAPTISEFWNRFYYYFKELLVEFFFYPTYFSCFKNCPRLRVLFATMMSVCVGNVIYHIFSYIEYPIRLGFFSAMRYIYMYALYGLVLGLAIGVSQLRLMRKKHPISGWRRYLLAPIIVIGFYMLMSIVNVPYRTTSLGAYAPFLLNLVNL